MTTRNRALAATTLAALALVLTGCGGSDQAASDAGMTADAPRAASGGAAAPEQAPGIADEGAARDDAGSPGGSGVNRTVVTVRSVIRTGSVSVTSKDVAGARTGLADVVARYGGEIDSEQTQSNDQGRIVLSTVTVRVPVDRFDEAMTAMGELGKVKRADSSSKDVTSEVIDVAERVQTLANSLDRLQKFQDDAQSIDELFRYENEITQREAELQSMRSQQAYLRDQTAMATITVSISTPPKVAAPPKQDDTLDDAGFLPGLRSGWAALSGTVLVVLTIVGALLPFAAVLLLVGLPTWLLVRRLVVRGKPAPPAPGTPANS